MFEQFLLLSGLQIAQRPECKPKSRNEAHIDSLTTKMLCYQPIVGVSSQELELLSSAILSVQASSSLTFCLVHCLWW